MNILGILAAMEAEVDAVDKFLLDKQEHYTHGIRFITGSIHNQACVVAQMGIGKVNAAMTTTLLISHYKPQKVICVGVAGGLNPTLLPGDTIIAEKIGQYDHGQLNSTGFQVWQTRNPMNKIKNPLLFSADDYLLRLAKLVSPSVQLPVVNTSRPTRKPNILTGMIVTGDVFVVGDANRNKLWQIFQADAVDMEGAAIAQICWQFGIGHLIIRSISDVDEVNIDIDWQSYLNIASQNAANLVSAIIKAYDHHTTPIDQEMRL